MNGTTMVRKSEQGFAVLQVLIVCAIVAAVAGIGLPVYASQAKDTVLRENAASLGLQVKSRLALDLYGGFVADGDGDEACGADGSVSAALARALRAGEAGRFKNPVSGSTAIVCQSEPPRDAGLARPAVWITDDHAFAYGSFSASAALSHDLEGTLLVVFVGRDDRTSAIDVFCVERGGRRSSEVAVVTL